MDMLSNFEQLAGNVHHAVMSEDQASLMSKSSDSIHQSLSSGYLADFEGVITIA